MIVAAILVLLALYVAFAVGVGFGRALERDRGSTPLPVRITPPLLPVRAVRVIARVSSPELAQWN